MDRARDGHDRLAFLDQTVAFRVSAHLARIGQAGLHLFILFQASYILGRADEGGDHWTAEGGLTERLHRNAIAGPVQTHEVIGNLFPIHYRAIITGIETEDRAWGRDRIGEWFGALALGLS